MKRPSASCRTLLLVAAAAALAGCDARVEHFEPNRVFAMALSRSRSVPTESASADAAVAIERVFGTPGDPRWPEGWIDGSSLVQVDRLRQAAGAVSSDESGTNLGLYRKHCVNCHGLAGSGSGPASLFQDPYPRNFRHGVFKWKSTERAAKPTREDLRRLLHRGVPGTAMPSFQLIPESDLESLVDYVIYLAVRGETERRLMSAAIMELDYDEQPPQEEGWQLTTESPESEATDLIRETVEGVVASWQRADAEVVKVDPPPSRDAEALAASIKRGGEIFHGPIANCVGCHGKEGNGQAVTLDYDDWGKEYSTRIGLTPTDREAMKPFRDVGALPPRPTEPRRFTAGVFRGGGDPETIYRQIAQGIAGTPMPRVSIVDEPSPTGLTSAQVWDLVHYVLSRSGQ